MTNSKIVNSKTSPTLSGLSRVLKIKADKGGLPDRVVEVLEDFGFLCGTDSINGVVTLSQYTPAGEDWLFSIESVEDLKSYIKNFDIDEEFRVLYDSKVSGLPSVKELIEDQEWKLGILQDVYAKIRNIE